MKAIEDFYFYSYTQCSAGPFPACPCVGSMGVQEFTGAYTNIRTSVLDKKKAALVALGSLAEHAPHAFYAHLPLAMETLTSQVSGQRDVQCMLDARMVFYDSRASREEHVGLCILIGRFCHLLAKVG